MNEEKSGARRVRILREFAALDLPATIGIQGASAKELSTIRTLFNEGFIEGHILPDHTGSGIAAIHVTGISEEADDLLQEIDARSAAMAEAPVPSGTPTKPYDIFLSYSHADEALMTLVREHMVLYDRLGLIRKWWDRKIVPGTPIDGGIRQYLASSDIVLLFISSSFLSSNYCYDVEMQQALRQHEEGRSVVVPIILRSCDWHRAPFGNLLALPTDGRALTSWPDRDEAATRIAQGILQVVAKLQARDAAP